MEGHEIPGEVYAWTAVLILPINSALNPFLYTLSAVVAKKVGAYVCLNTLVPDIVIWPASHEKGPSAISHSVDQDQTLYDFENTYT